MNPMSHLKIHPRIFLTLLAIISFMRCISQSKNAIDYIGQKPPGMVAELFAPGVVSTHSYEHSAPAFSPDGSVVVWTVVDSTFRAHMVEMRFENGRWSKPASPTFADTTADDYYPSFSPDGKRLFFSSRRKLPAGYRQSGDIRIWEVERNKDGWGKPVPFDTAISRGNEYAHSVTKNGTIYFSSSDGGGPSFNIRKSEKINGRNTKPGLLPYNINSVDYEDGPYVAPDESFLIFESQRPEGADAALGLYISFRLDNGQWGLPVNMGTKINSGRGERFARLSPDGKYLFFGSFRNMSGTNRGADIYWIDAKVIDELRNVEAAKTKIEQPLGDEIMEALLKNETAGSARLLKQWLYIYPNHLDATVIYSSVLRKQRQYADAEQLLAKIPGHWNENVNVLIEKGLLKFAADQDEEAHKILSSVLKEGSQLRNRYLYLSNALLDMEKFRQSDVFFEKAMLIRSHGFFWFNRGRSYTRLGYKDKAFETLGKAVSLGYDVRKNYEADPDLVPLKSDSRWEVLMKQLK
jgi:hypothetical protein